MKILETAYDRIRVGGNPPVLLAGDFNAPKDELADGTIVPWRSEDRGSQWERWSRAERNILRGQEEMGMVDVFRHIHGYEDVDVAETSIHSLRFDHQIASDEMGPTKCNYDHDGLECGDHAPIIGEFE